MESLHIQTAAKGCSDLFDARVAEQNTAVQDSQLDEEADCLETQRARFNLWSDNIGVFAEGNASLDFRLLENGDVAELVVGQLHTLQRHLKRLSGYLASVGDQDKVRDAENLYHEDDTDCSSVSSISSFTTGTSESKSNKGEIHEYPPLVGIISAVQRLHRLSMAIRGSQSIAAQNKKAQAEMFFDAEGIDIVAAFQEYTLELLRFRLKGASDTLLQRLSAVNAERRRRFLYRQKHQRKLRGRRESAPKEQSKPIARTASRITNTSVLQVGNESLRPPASIARAGTLMSGTEASQFDKKHFKYEQSCQSTIKSAVASTQLLIDSSLFPPAPRIPAGASEFFCPYCCRIQPATERGGRRWRQHFLKDLEPLVCLAEDCAEPYNCFHDRDQWLDHMGSHNRQFTCRLPGHVPRVFATDAQFEEHINHRHGKVNATQLKRLKEYNGTGGRLAITGCPLCGFTSSAGNHDQAYMELFAHIADELQHVAMWSLIESDEIDDDIPSAPSERRAVDESTQAGEEASLTFELGKKLELADWFNEDEPPLAEEFEILHEPPHGCNPKDEWVFMELLSNEVYAGHAFDPKLENFLRRVQLEQLLDSTGKADPVLPCNSLPMKKNKDFFGHQGLLQRLERALYPNSKSESLSTMTLTGPAGIGKTQIAAEFCLNMESRYDAILWVHADEESKLANDFSTLAVRLGFVAENSADARDHAHCRQLVKAWLANPLKKLSDSHHPDTASWMLVFDHVIDPKVLEEYWPAGCRSGSILITSRKRMPWGETKYPALTVEPFNPNDSATFLHQLTRIEGNDQQRITLGNQAHHSPTQLMFLAKMITLGRYSLKKFIEASQDGTGEQVILRLHTQDVEMNKTDFAEWALESLGEKASALLDILSMLDADQIVERMLINPPDNVNIPNYPVSQDEYVKARSELIDHSIITKDRVTGNFTIHRLIQDAVRKRMNTSYYRDVFNSCVALLNDAWPYQPFTWRHSISRWPKCEDLYPHIIRLRQFSKSIETLPDDIAGAYEYARLTTDAAWYCHERGRSQEASVGPVGNEGKLLTHAVKGETFCDIGERICNKLKLFLDESLGLGKVVKIEHINDMMAEIHHNRGTLTAEMNRPLEALQHQCTFNRMMMDETKDKHPGTDMRLAISFNQIGVAYMINGEVQTAEACFQRSIAEMERLDDYERFKISLPVVNAASCALLDGRYAQAEEMLRQGLADRIAKFGKDDQESFITGRFYHGLGMAKLGQSMYDDSLDFLEKAREHYKITVGRGHHRTADIAMAIGRHHARVGQNEKAVQWFDKALSVYGDRDIYAPEKARAFFKRSRGLRRLGRAVEADNDEEHCLKLYRQLVAHDGRTLDELGDHDFDKLIVFWSR